MQRCFIPPQRWGGSTLALPANEQHHVLHVLRLSANSRIVAFDGQGHEAETRLLLPQEPSGQAYLQLVEAGRQAQSATTPNWILVPAIIKGTRMDSLIEKATELGASSIMPIQTLRCVVKLDKKQALNKIERWKRIAISAAKQCGTPRLPVIHPVASLTAVLDDLQQSQVPILQGSLQSNSAPIATVARKWIANGSSRIAILIGPEGDFTPAEYEESQAAGCIPVSLGNLTLRAETATIFSLSLLQALYAEQSTAQAQNCPPQTEIQ